MPTIRVLHILHSMNRGGAECAIMNYYRFIDREIVQFDFLLTEQNKCQFEDEIHSLGGRVFRVPLLSIMNPFPYLNGVKRFFHSHPEYKIVHSHTSSKSVFPLLLAKRAGIPIRLCHSHNSKTEHGLSGRIRNLLKAPLRCVATHFCACGDQAAIWLYGQRLFLKGVVQIVPNVIETPVFDYNPETRRRVRAKLGISDSTVVIGCTARFSYQKNHAFLVSLFDEFHHSFTDSKLLLLGDGKFLNQIEDRVEELGIKDAVIFAGVVPNVADYEQAMDFFLLTSFHEGIPLSMIEAQISGLRCFASEGVPQETDKTGLVTFISLDKGPRYWADLIITAIGYERESRIDDIRRAGYDAATSAHMLQSYYQNLYSKIR